MNTHSLEEEKETLKKTSSFTILEYIKNSIDILVDIKIEEKLNKSKNNEEEYDYESMLKKLEADIRSHIKVKK